MQRAAALPSPRMHDTHRVARMAVGQFGGECDLGHMEKWCSGQKEAEKNPVSFLVCSSVTDMRSLSEPEWASGIDCLQANCLPLQMVRPRSATGSTVGSRANRALASLHNRPGLSCPTRLPGDDSRMGKKTRWVPLALEQIPERLFAPPHLQV